MRRPPALATKAALLLLAVAFLGACGDGRSGWGAVEAEPSETPTTVSLRLGEEATLNGPNSVQLRVSLNFTRQPPVPLNLSPESATFIEMHLTVTNTGTAPFSGVLADAADLAVAPSGTVAPVRGASVPSGIAISGGLDFAEPVTIAPGSPAVQGKMVFQIDPDDDVASFSLTLPGGADSAQWTL